MSLFKKKEPAPQPTSAAAVKVEQSRDYITGDGAYHTTHSATLIRTPLGFGLHLTSDNVVLGVNSGSQAERSGAFESGDKVVILNGLPLKPGVTVMSELKRSKPGDSVTFGLQRPPKGVESRGPVPMGTLVQSTPVPQLELVKTPGEPTFNELNAWLQAYTTAFTIAATTNAPDMWLACFAPGPIVAHIDAARGFEGREVKVYNGSVCAALCNLMAPASLMAMKIFAQLHAANYASSVCQLLAAGRLHHASSPSSSSVLLHVRVGRFNTAGAQYETVGALYRLKRSVASFVIEELWALPDGEVANIPMAIRESGVLWPQTLR